MVKIVGFDDLEFERMSGYYGQHGVRAEHQFPNGYGVSVVRHRFSYGSEEGLYELAVTTKDGICYDTPVTDDVLGWLDPAKVTEAMQAVAALPPYAGPVQR